MILARETVLLAAVCLADLVLTLALISTGYFTEGNPILGHYLQYGLGAMALVKLGSFLLPLAIAEWYRPRHPMFVRCVLRATLYLYIAGYVIGVTSVNLPVLSSLW